MLEASADAYYVLRSERDAAGRIVDFVFEDLNARGAAVFGRAKEAIIGRKLRELLPSGRFDTLFRSYQRVAETGRAKKEEIAMNIPGLRARWIRQQVVPTPEGIAIVAQNITGRRRAERGVRQNHAFLQMLVDSLPLLVYAKSARSKDFGQLVIWNKAAQSITGYSEQEVLGRTFSDAFPRAPATPSVALDIRVLGNQAPVTVEYPFPRRDGSVRVLRTHAVSVPDELDRPEYILGITEDVTEHKGALEELQLASAVFKHATEAIIVSDAQDRVLRVNRAFCELTGFAEDEVVGRPTAEFELAEENAEDSDTILKEVAERGHWTGPGALRRKLGEPIPCWRNIACVIGDSGEVSIYVRIATDVTTLVRSREELEQQANHDALTGLPNRRLFHDRLAHALAGSERSNETLALLFVDLDGFKAVNDDLGHAVGDLLLKEVAHRLSACARRGDTVCRLGGDEFTVIMEASGQRHEAALVAQRILDALREPFVLGAHSVTATASIGISVYPEDGVDSALLLKCADRAMYRAKELGKGRYQFYADVPGDPATEVPSLDRELAFAIGNDELSLVYQPIINLNSGRATGLEALVRWNHPTGLRLPDDFIPIAESKGLIVPLGEWVLRRACADMHRWERMGLRDFSVAVNVSACQFQRGDLVQAVEVALRESGIPPSRLALELTETATLENLAGAEAIVLRLRAMGVGISIDDFGTGYASLKLLKRIGADVLKIDRAFVRGLADDAGTLTIVRAIMLLGRSLKMGVVAEGVETRPQLDALTGLNCAEVQGYFFSRPVPADAVPAMFQEARWLPVEASQ